MKQLRGTGAGRLHHGFLAMTPGGAIRFIGGIGSKGGVVLAEKGRFPRRAKMRDTGRDVEIAGIK
jgi:hypothetical protein